MSTKPDKIPAGEQEERESDSEALFVGRISDRAARRLRAERAAERSFWHGLGAIGTVGWTVGLPTIGGVLLGVWIDSRWPTSPISWTLVLLIAGLFIGSFSAWLWLEGERKEIERARRELMRDIEKDVE